MSFEGYAWTCRFCGWEYVIQCPTLAGAQAYAWNSHSGVAAVGGCEYGYAERDYKAEEELRSGKRDYRAEQALRC